MKKMKEPEISIVIPVYNSEKSLPVLVELIFTALQETAIPYEIVFVNDASLDNSLKTLTDLYEKYDFIKIIDLQRNYGQQNALLCGFAHTEGKYIVTMDDDLQHDPDDIITLYREIKSGYDAIFASYDVKKDKVYKNLGSWFIRKMNHHIFSLKNDLRFSSFRIIKKEIIDRLALEKSPFPYISGMIMEQTKHVKNVQVKHHQRQFGKSNYNLRKLINLAMNLLINYSSIPLKLITFGGLFLSMLSIAAGTFYAIKQIVNGNAPTGWTSLFLLISVNNAIILIIFIILGEYISRILKEMSSPKTYIIREVWQKKD
jgi:glycosyltransferase involved in cell wall biosynthesis